MPELELTPVEDGQPPHVDIRVDADDEYLLRSVRIYRDGEEIRARIPDRIPRIRVSDFEAPYDTEIDYVVEGQQIPDEEPLIDERWRSEEHTSELQSRGHLVCRLLLEKKN